MLYNSKVTLSHCLIGALGLEQKRSVFNDGKITLAYAAQAQPSCCRAPSGEATRCVTIVHVKSLSLAPHTRSLRVALQGLLDHKVTQ